MPQRHCIASNTAISTHLGILSALFLEYYTANLFTVFQKFMKAQMKKGQTKPKEILGKKSNIKYCAKPGGLHVI